MNKSKLSGIIYIIASINYVILFIISTIYIQNSSYLVSITQNVILLSLGLIAVVLSAAIPAIYCALNQTKITWKTRKSDAKEFGFVTAFVALFNLLLVINLLSLLGLVSLLNITLFFIGAFIYPRKKKEKNPNRWKKKIRHYG